MDDIHYYMDMTYHYYYTVLLQEDGEPEAARAGG